MSYGGQPTCRSCGAEIVFIQTENGKYMPCELKPSWVIPVEEGGSLFYTGDGAQIRGRTVDKRLKGAVRGYQPHWGNCSGRERHRKPDPGPMHRRPDALTERIRAQVEKEKADAQRRAERRQQKEAEEQALREAMEAQLSLFQVQK